MKKKTYIYGMIMVLITASLTAIPFMPFLHMNILAEYLGLTELSAVRLARQMYALHLSPDATSLFGYAHYYEVTLALSILSVVMAVLPVVLSAVSMLLALPGRSVKRAKAAAFLSFLNVLLYVGVVLGFTFAGRVVNAMTQAAWGSYVGLAAACIFWFASLGVVSDRKASGQRKRTAVSSEEDRPRTRETKTRQEREQRHAQREQRRAQSHTEQ